MENRFLPPQKDICKTFIAQDFIILGYAVLHLHKLHLGRIQSILGFVGWFDLGKKKEKKKENPWIVGTSNICNICLE